jgi:hypothetical protein
MVWARAHRATIVAIALVVSTASASEPLAWIHYGANQYLTGRGMSDNPNARERLAEAENDALAALSRSIRTHVTSEFETLRREDPEKYEETTRVHNSATSMIEVSGVEPVLRHADGDVLHTLAYISREKARRVHHGLATSLARDIHAQLDVAARLAEADRRQEALRSYASVYPLLERLEDALAVLLVVDGAPPEVPFSRSEVEENVARVENAPVNSLRDAAQVLLSRLRRSGKLGARVHTRAFTYARSDFASAFSHHFQRLMASELGPKAVEGTKSFRAKGIDYALEVGRQSNATSALFGTYQEVGDAVHVYARAVDTNTGKRVAAADVAIPRSLVVQSNLDLKPQNFLQALEDSGLIASGEILSGAMRLELWTDHGRDGLLLQENDVYNVSVRVNRPCTIRLLYHLADGARVVMYDDYPIASHMVNQGVQIPGRFRVVAPFGAETIQAFAYIDRPAPLRTRLEQIAGQTYTLVDETLASAMKGYKGFVHEEESDDPDGREKHATVQLHVTTVP